MDDFFKQQLHSFSAAKLQGERVRICCMILFVAFFTLIGIYRIIKPVEGGENVGWMVLGISVSFLLYELLMLSAVTRGMRDGQDLSTNRWRIHSIVECLYPIVAIIAIRFTSDRSPFTLLVSPAYPFIIILIAVAVLHLDRGLTILTGVTGTFAYLITVILVLATQTESEINPHPLTMYFTLTIMLAIATVVSVFMTGRIRNYVSLAVSEMDMRRQRDQMERDLDLAREIQQNLLPSTIPNLDGYDIAAHCQPADQTGGDYYDWQLIDNHRIVVSLADVTGHGVGPALVTAACRAYVRSTVTRDATPLDVINKVNKLLHEDMPSGRFVTFAMVDLDTQTNKAVLMSAGHGPTLLVKRDTGDIESIAAQGLPMGITEENMFDEAIDLRFEPGDVAVLFTDGFFEWANADGEQFGLNRLRRVITDNREARSADLIRAMDESIRAFIGDRRQDDDMTALVIRRLENNQS
jgi:serine phosphatase RsbU (regulator of sigma subunit)